ncbi:MULTISPECIES: hydrolase [Clostridium]|uniref:Hydrolase n=2 Tax=Clostridium TaxID=1485 RepID=A0A0B5QHL3_CLOBE|nr:MULTISPECIES: hydrolase [Clostridium]AJH01860.1 hydrolase [Clostridium beijerinckii]MBC2455706.1 hydrolase [Clostridium beijerinckii]MBC2473183.1 hydrolase [Clostridium beijerinckii]MBN7573197.1 hydrolase [Clostridium beijerinckii]MBN7578536.1 hydrolase [Clostridium beijerinckii]
MTNKDVKYIPQIKGTLRNHVIEVPAVIRNCGGIKIFGKRIKSLLFSTDVALIRNSNADAIIAVYPFTPQPVITQALVMAADVPVFCGVGGGITQGKRVVNLAMDAEFKGAMGVVVNAPTSNEIVNKIRSTIDIPVIVTVISEDEDIAKRIEAGATILNVSGGRNTANIVRNIRKRFPEFPIIATGGPTEESIKETIQAGANAITFTPPTSASIMGDLMDEYRKE